MYDVNFARKLCQRIGDEQESEKVQDMLGLLVAVARENDEEVWLRMTFLEHKYGISFDKVTPDGKKLCLPKIAKCQSCGSPKYSSEL